MQSTRCGHESMREGGALAAAPSSYLCPLIPPLPPLPPPPLHIPCPPPLKQVFAECGTTVLLCDFHRLQAWWRNINKGDMGVPTARKKVVFGALISLA